MSALVSQVQISNQEVEQQVHEYQATLFDFSSGRTVECCKNSIPPTQYEWPTWAMGDIQIVQRPCLDSNQGHEKSRGYQNLG